MRRLLCFLLLLTAVGFTQKLQAQYYTWGSDPAGLKWSYIRTPDVRMIYPDTAANVARHTLFFIRTVQPDISYGFRHGPMRIPFVMHPENFQSNGLVMFLPKRVEFLTSPAIDGYSMLWYKQLVAHEYRHAVQYNNLNRGVIRALSYVLGQQGSTVGLLCMPIWAMEGDAVMSETAMSSFGRGLQPSFSIGYRAMGRVGRDRKDGRYRHNIDKWFCGSYRDYIPDHYQLGYQICSYANAYYGENVWDQVAWFGSRNPYMLATTRIALEKYYDTNVSKLFRATFDKLEAHWASIPPDEDSAHTLTPLPEKNYTTYQWPVALSDTTLLVLKTDFDRWSRLVEVDTRSGAERIVCRVGQLSSRPMVGDRRVWWTEYRRSTLFEQRVNSQLCYMDLDDGKAHTARGRNVLYPTPIPPSDRRKGAFAWVEYTPDGRYTVYEVGDVVFTMAQTTDLAEIHGLAWDDETDALYVIVTDDRGMWLGRIGEKKIEEVTQPAYITLSNLRAGGGKLYYGSIASGKDEAYYFDLATRRQYRITTSTYGSFSPTPSAQGEELFLTTYSRRGYRLTKQPLVDSLLHPAAETLLPRNVVNPERKRWAVVNLDTVRFSDADSLAQRSSFPTKRYRKGMTLINVHSWTPVAFNPFDAVDEHNVNLNLGVTLLSQNLLSNTEAYASYGWNKNEGSMVNLGVRYFGLGVHMGLEATYGGNQLFYSLMSYDPQTGAPVYQTRPNPDKYYKVELSASLPLFFQRGYHTRQLSLSSAWNYSNGMVAKLDKIEWGEGGGISNIQRIGFSEGLHKLSFGLGFSDQVRMAFRDIAPRWGYTLSALYTFNPANNDFSDLISFYGQVYLPGFALHNSLKVAGTYQTSVGGYKFPAGYSPLTYKSTRLIPRGFKSADIVSNNYSAASVDYQFPLWYPEGGISSVVYFKRIRLNLGGDFAQFRRPVGEGLDWRRIWSVGADLVFDVNVFRQPASATSTVKLSVYHPSSGGVWCGASVGLPF